MKRGKILLADLPMPSTSYQLRKIRPVLLIQADFLTSMREDLIVIPISSNLKRKGDKTTVVIDDYASYGLKQQSIILCSSLLTIPKFLIKKGLGKLSDEILHQVEAKILTAIGIFKDSYR